MQKNFRKSTPCSPGCTKKKLSKHHQHCRPDNPAIDVSIEKKNKILLPEIYLEFLVKNTMNCLSHKHKKPISYRYKSLVKSKSVMTGI